MTKIRVEFEVPAGDYCNECNHFCIARDWDWRYKCLLFNEQLTQQLNGNVFKCNVCKNAEVKE